MTGMSRSAIYAAIAKGCFPESIQLSARSVAWAESAINAWIKSKIDAAKPKAAPIKFNSYESDTMRRWSSLSKREQDLEIKQARLNGDIHFSEI